MEQLIYWTRKYVQQKGMLYEFFLEFLVFFEGQEVGCGKVLSAMAPIFRKVIMLVD
jgi:hypothetical protein